MKKLALICAFSLAALPSFAETTASTSAHIVMEDTASSAAGTIVPLILLFTLVLVAASSGSHGYDY